MASHSREAELARLFYRELEKIMDNEVLAPAARREALYQLLHLIFFEATQHERLPFSTHFARLAYAAHQYGLSRRLMFYVHQFRRRARETEGEEALEALGRKVIAEVILGIFRAPPPAALAERLPLHWPLPAEEVPVAAFRPQVRVLVVGDDPDKEQLLARDAEQPNHAIRIQYNLPDRNELFTPTIALLRQVTGFPVTLHLLDVEIDQAGVYRPRALVLEPDYLIDVSAVAESFQGSTTHPWGYLLKRYLPFEQTPPLLLGHIANFFLDELMANPAVTFAELRRGIFSLNPLAFCLFSDQQVKALIQKSQGHFLCLKQLVNGGLAAEGIATTDAFLEPTFYSERYGLQGRLDLLHRPPGQGEQTAIVELKSGKPFMANIHGISPNHFIQTLLYDLLIRSAFGADANIGAYILYSSVPERPLRFAPRVQAQQFEALQLRNQLVAIEYLLGQLGTEDTPLTDQADRLFRRLKPSRHPTLKGFHQRDLAHFTQVYEQLEPVERAYFAAFSGFIAREHRLAKTGMQGQENVNGLASLWLDDRIDKDQQYQLLADLRVTDNATHDTEPLLTLARTEATNPLANFRVGDIAVLFPATDDGRGMLNHQVYKCTLVALDARQVQVRLRSRQSNPRIFDEIERWNLEHDLLDSSFLAYYRGLFTFAGSPSAQRQLLLGMRPPERPGALPNFDWPAGLTDEQGGILRQMLAAPEYFLLWGPPGTGKTSVMLRQLVHFLMAHTEEHVLLLAYTNRAVDEICEAIESIGDDMRDHYLRIGSRYGTAPAFQEQLLQTRIEGLQNRRDLKALLDSRRIFVGTVASLAGKTELFQLKTFQRVIIDEASQILEPLLLGLLPHFQRWILIGDHRQLPAVVTQRDEDALVRDPALREAGVTDLGQSLFERLYLRAQAAG
ncbi:MAG: AAA family ATPase, partial [Lewinella sp.]|nr:AAA family ATPase [Lewinella sp.]